MFSVTGGDNRRRSTVQSRVAAAAAQAPVVGRKWSIQW
jgi:hypothetical protein